MLCEERSRDLGDASTSQEGWRLPEIHQNQEEKQGTESS